MSVTYIPIELRRLVIARAEELCEYCLIHESDTFFGCHVDHIISEKHGGLTQEDNLSYACLYCNLHKGSDVSSLIPGTRTLVRFFHPHEDRWKEHFALHTDGITIVPLTEIGEATARIFEFNTSARLSERQIMRDNGRYPTTAAQKRIDGE